MDIDCENRCGDRKKKGVNLMTGAELIKWIREHHAEKMDILIDIRYANCFITEVKIIQQVGETFVLLR